jgi:hypothetical protein
MRNHETFAEPVRTTASRNGVDCIETEQGILRNEKTGVHFIDSARSAWRACCQLAYGDQDRSIEFVSISR